MAMHAYVLSVDNPHCYEGVDPSPPENFTRPWFPWAKSMFAELLQDSCGTGGASRDHLNSS